jgi:heme A synthase
VARKIWIGILGFGIFLFVLLDIFLGWYLVTSKSSAREYGELLIPILLTWRAYVALKRRIDSKPEKPVDV